MTTTPRVAAGREGARGISALMLARRGAVFLPGGAGEPVSPADPAAAAGIALLEADLLDRGYLLAPGLREKLTARGVLALTAAGRTLLADIDEALGADRDHTPLFRDFPDSTPRDTLGFYVDRVLTLIAQRSDQPCVLCGLDGRVRPVAPCAHLVCRTCFDGSDFAACPVCHRRIDPDDPFLLPGRPRQRAAEDRPLPDRPRVLTYGGDLAARSRAAGDELLGLLTRPAALSPRDTDDLLGLLAVHGPTDLAWLPAVLPGRETKARVLAWLLEQAADPPAGNPARTGGPARPQDPATANPATAEPLLTGDDVRAAVGARLDTATDILRLLAVRAGGDAGLVDFPRVAPLPRPLRRTLLAALDRLDPASAVPDMRRHRAAWTRVAHALHPFEFAGRFPRAALAVASLRALPLGDDLLGARLRAAAGAPAGGGPGPRTGAVVDGGGRVRVNSWSGRLETALARGELPAATALLAQRPGELVRRLDHLLRIAGDDPDTVLAALGPAARRVAPAVLLSALGALRGRRRAPRDRVFFPKGGSARAHITADLRAPAPVASVEAAVAVLLAEVLRRAAAQGPVDTAVVDTGLGGLIAPFAERTASRALVTLPRGSELPLADGRLLRLFLHWMESEESGRTDLDLSVAFFDHAWTHLGTCDYTALRFQGEAAVHSGDLTSAPPPKGASEFVDLDPARLEMAGVRYAAAVVLAYNSVPFVRLADAFAGIMARDEPGPVGPVFDPRAVEQRFDLTSGALVCVPMILDLRTRTLRWLDVTQDVTGTDHAMHRHLDVLGLLGRTLTELFASGARVGLGELAVWQAAARASVVQLRDGDGTVTTYGRRPGEAVADFAARIGGPDSEPPRPLDPARTGAAFLFRGDFTPAPGSSVYALHPGDLDPSRLRLLTAPDVVNSLAPN
ncbi:MXAN_6230/SCO0854 family RING domain-containing protein [Streptomyces sp. NBC_01190]|uniref:MXAN_6230/SCO0854 family RING domain-containing protein n=1 Tax=Streptomyces sp. NBC_01190 TaxID=2903767 RepID=UPI00386788D6|nr:hypothetical protein OG519_00595 [Streptomyces sp. NBC_01190]